MSKFKVGDRVRVVDPSGDGDLSRIKAGDLGVVTQIMDRTYDLLRVELDSGHVTEMFDFRFEPAPVSTPDVGKVITFEQVQVGDTVRGVEVDGDVEYTWTATVAEIFTSAEILTPQGHCVYVSSGSTLYLVNRPERDAEVQALMDALGVDEDTASDMHSKGARIVGD